MTPARDATHLPTTQRFKVVLVFNLKPGTADEELRRSAEPSSFPSALARQPGFVGMELVKISDEQTMSVQTWASPEAWWAALDAARTTVAEVPGRADREEILISREFYAGTVARIASHGADHTLD